MATKIASPYMKGLAKELLKHAAKDIISQAIRSQFTVWRQLHLKRKRRELDLIWHQEDEARQKRAAPEDSEEDALPRAKRAHGAHLRAPSASEQASRDGQV